MYILKWLQKCFNNFLIWCRENSVSVRWLIAATSFIFIFILLSSPFIVQRIKIDNLKVGEICQEDIISSKFITHTFEDGNTVILKKGQVIIRKGEEITADKLKKIEVFYSSEQGFVLSALFGMGLMSIAFLLMIVFYLYVYKRTIFNNNKLLFLISLIIIVTLGVSRLISSLGAISNFLIPVAFASITLAILVDSSTSFIITVILSVMAGIVCKFDMNVTFVMLSGGLVGIYGATKVKRRIDLTKVGLYVGGMNFLVITAVGLVGRLSFNRIIIEGLWGAGNGLIFSVSLVMGTLLYFESMFGITTNFKLMELSDLNLDLLKNLFLKASGTYQHSLLVSELAEKAAEEVGANSLLTKVGGYYHDIGKMENPTYFIENQMPGVNTHNGINPEISNSILNAHIKDGVEIAKRYHLPPEVIDIIEQHHGTSSKMYFMSKENSQEFRYPGPKPQTKEAALVMLADSVEAATRASSNKNFQAMEKKVKTIINNYLTDLQLEECPLTLRDLTKIGNSFIKVLSGIYHFRIEYPENNINHNQKNTE
ncbi:hypothetical protein AUJ66_07665 [Candidatus Desantisbacteria bacterium CG1_02_38_46]|uniref:HD domain-containing protein n=1 Tax=Candidatus Desantisbacteria bacterium CG1_02_38_46 TaxID=1817893 RepID=A0A1J4SCL6_9BACT|nr:MAG: hypothetical protein AUJ66_07665 [Candidatus Desantisbacteria bacterium CG1_02_38_46]